MKVYCIFDPDLAIEETLDMWGGLDACDEEWIDQMLKEPHVKYFMVVWDDDEGAQP